MLWSVTELSEGRAMAQRICAIVGAGPGNGLAFARRFAAGGYGVALVGRDAEKLGALAAEVPGGRAVAADARDPASLRAAFDTIGATIGPVDVLLYNAGSGQWGNFQEITPEGLEAGWRTNVLGLLVAGQAVAEGMIGRGSGAIVVTGATASLRGNVGTAAFASAKAGQRSLAQSMAKHLGPKGVHVAHVIVDGVISTPSTRASMTDRPDEFFLKPEDIAEAVFFLAHQDRSAWTFELDLRPFGESW
jgi:NAD(P)-dependent dehydrogenase (short-subunit alcohol dehydrogenase family)